MASERTREHRRKAGKALRDWCRAMLEYREAAIREANAEMDNQFRAEMLDERSEQTQP